MRKSSGSRKMSTNSTMDESSPTSSSSIQYRRPKSSKLSSIQADPDSLVSIREAAKIVGAHPGTLRRWDGEGVLKPHHTPGGFRRYLVRDLLEFCGKGAQEETVGDGRMRVAVYCRVSGRKQEKEGDLDRQVGRVVIHCAQENYDVVAVIKDVGSGMSVKRPGLAKLFESVESKSVDRIVVEHRDRLTRFMGGYLERYFKSYGVSLEVVHEILGKSYEEELVEDILSLMASFSAKIYGRRSAKIKKAAT